MNLVRPSHEEVEQALDALLVQAAGECAIPKPRNLRRKITELKPVHTKPAKLGAPPRKVWWPASCRGIVG